MKHPTMIRAITALLLLCLLGTTVLCSCSEGRSLLSAALNGQGELILTYSDGTTENLGVVKGEDGLPGKKGESGDVGQAGENGANGTVLSDAHTQAAAKGLQSAVSIYCYDTPTSASYSAAGSGVIWRLDRETGDALIITNYHVVYGTSYRTADGICSNIRAYLYGAEYKALALEAEYLGGSMYYDIAVLSVKGSEVLKQSNAVAATLADSEQIRVGADAIAVGNPKGLGISASVGIVSVDSEYIPMKAADGVTPVTMRVMRVDTAVNAGNSGGGLYNADGALCGIVNAKIMADGVENIAYAIPSNLAIAVAQNVVDHCDGTTARRVRLATLGVTVDILDSDAEWDEDGYVRIVEKVGVRELLQNGAAYGKLRVNDVILSVTLGEKTVSVTKRHHVVDLLIDARVGDVLTFTVSRQGEEDPVTVSITVGSNHVKDY